MATTYALTANVRLVVSWNQVATNDSGNTITDANNDTFALAITPGTGANGTADQKFSKKFTVAAGTPLDLDLSGALTDDFGRSILLARAKVLMVRVLGSDEDPASTGGPVTLGNGANPFATFLSAGTTTIPVTKAAGRKGCFLLALDDATAYAVTAGTGDILRIVSAAGNVTVVVTAIGSSA